MIIGGEDKYVKIDFVEARGMLQGIWPDTICSVEVRCGEFRGRVERVWFLAENITAFMSDFAKLRPFISNTARLRNFYSTDPPRRRRGRPDDEDEAVDPCRFEISSSDEEGDFVLYAEVAEAIKINGLDRALRAAVAFPLGWRKQDALLDEFRKLFYGW